VPFASPTALYRLSRLSVWWLRLGIRIERIEPGHPQQNGRHERMHLTLKKEATKPAAPMACSWLVSVMQYDLGYFDDETIRVEPIENSFGSKVLPMSPE
jgi:transposase InsO family protein